MNCKHLHCHQSITHMLTFRSLLFQHKVDIYYLRPPMKSIHKLISLSKLFNVSHLKFGFFGFEDFEASIFIPISSNSYIYKAKYSFCFTFISNGTVPFGFVTFKYSRPRIVCLTKRSYYLIFIKYIMVLTSLSKSEPRLR